MNFCRKKAATRSRLYLCEGATRLRWIVRNNGECIMTFKIKPAGGNVIFSSNPLVENFAAIRIQRWVRSRMNLGSYAARLQKIGHVANPVWVVPLPNIPANQKKLKELNQTLRDWLGIVDSWIAAPPQNKKQKSDRPQLSAILIDAQIVLDDLLERMQTKQEEFLLMAAYDLNQRVQAVAAICLADRDIEILALCSAPSNFGEERLFRGGATAMIEEIYYANRCGQIMVCPSATAEGFYTGRYFCPDGRPRSEYECESYVLRNAAMEQFIANKSGYAVPPLYFLGKHPIMRSLMGKNDHS